MSRIRLVNAAHPLPADRRPEDLIWIDGQTRLDPECAQALDQWIHACDGQQDVTFVSGWRSFEEQAQIMAETERDRGYDYAHQFVAETGCSEHHTGLAIDLGIAGQDQDLICPDFSGPAAKRMGKKAAEFGFILRYAQDKIHITHISEEPWHFRYVGLPHSLIMAERNWALEEYAEWLKNQAGQSFVYEHQLGSWQVNVLTADEIAGSDDHHQSALAAELDPLDENTFVHVEKKEPSPIAEGTERSWVELNRSALRHNLITLKKQMRPRQEMMAVLKANGYGLGLRPMTEMLKNMGVKAYAVATLEEARTIRELDPDAEILILGFIPVSQIPIVSCLKLMITLTDYDYACQIDQTGVPVLAQVPVDTGMHRLGERAEDLEALLRYYQFKNLHIAGTYSHLYMTDLLEDHAEAATSDQIQMFFQTISRLKQRGIDPGKLHLQGTYGFLNHPELECDWLRIGIALTGCVDPGRSRTALNLSEVASVHTRIAAVRELKQGESAGYNYAWTADRDTRIAVLSIGYSDGLFRSCSRQGADVLIRGRRCPLVGAMCMDQCLADISDLDAKVGEEAVVIGSQGHAFISAMEVAEKTGTIVPETLSAWRSRMPRLIR